MTPKSGSSSSRGSRDIQDYHRHEKILKYLPDSAALMKNRFSSSEISDDKLFSDKPTKAWPEYSNDKFQIDDIDRKMNNLSLKK